MIRITKKGGIIAVIDIDAHFLNHYPIDPELYNDLKKVMDILERDYGFDPYIGRKLFHLMYKANIENISIDIEPYQKIAGEPDQNTLNNWKYKFEVIFNLLEKNKSLDINWLKDLARRLVSHVTDKNTFSYSNLIIARGTTC